MDFDIDYGKLLDVYGCGKSHYAETELEFEAALQDAWDTLDQPHLIHAKLVEGDGSDTLKNLADRMSKTVG